MVQRFASSLQRARGLAAAVLAACALLPAPAQAQSQGSSWWMPAHWTRWLPFQREPGPPPPTGVQDPHYGDSLFHFYQSRYFTSVTNLMVSQHFKRMPVHADEAEILRGGLFLSYGLHKEAGEVFAQLIERGAKPHVRDRAWYFLAKIRYQRGLMVEADDALGRIGKELPPDLEEDRQLLKASVLMATGRYGEAVELLKAVKTESDAIHYARFNLGVALIRDGKPLDGDPVLAALGGLATDNEELRALRDRANLALGFSSLQLNNTVLARDYLQRIRLNGPVSNKALLGFGWAAAQQGRYNHALAPWTELAKRDPSDIAVLEARLAVPYAYAELGAHQQSAALYQEAIAGFDAQSRAIDASIAAIRGGQLLDELIRRNPGDEMGWFWNIAELPDVPHVAPLAPILATHEFQEAFKNYRDLLFLGENLRQWQEKLSVLRDMLANRKQAFAERLPEVQARERTLNVAELEQRTDALRTELVRVETEADVAALADARERDLVERLASVRQVLANRPADMSDAEYAAAQDRARRAAGALLWQQNEQFPARLWNATRAMNEVERTLREAQRRDAALVRAQRDEPGRLDAFGQRIEALASRVDAMTPRIAQLTREQQAAVQDLVVAQLQLQQERLASFGTQARFAVAQLYDRAGVAKDKEGAAGAAGAATPAAVTPQSKEGAGAPAR